MTPTDVSGPPPYRPLVRRARAAVAALAAVAVVDALVAVDDVVEARMLARAVADPDAVSDDRLQLRDTLATVGAGAQLLTLAAATVLFLLWYHRAYRNIGALGREPDRSGAWAVISWFVPIANLFVPKGCANDIARLGQADRDVPRTVHVWWGFWIASLLLGNALARTVADAQTLEGIRKTHIVSAVTNVVDLVAAVLAIRVVQLLTARQEEAARARPAAGDRAGVPPDRRDAGPVVPA